MLNETEKAQFLEQGYLHVPGVLQGEHLANIQSEFDRVWDMPGQSSQHKLLQHQAFIDLISHKPILERHQAIFGSNAQLLQYDLLRQGPRNETFPERAWHRDFVFTGDTPLSVNTILFLDPVTEEVGPTCVVPGTHRGPEKPSVEQIGVPHPEEVALHAAPGDAVFINAAIWHSGRRNQSDGLRRGIYLYYGYWWLKRYDAEKALPWQALEGADDERLTLLGIRNPGSSDLHQY